MKIILQNGVIALNDDFEFPITAHHPFFSEDGVSSAPIDIPATPENLFLLGNPENFRNARRYPKEFKAILQVGALEKRCSLIVGSAGTDGISATLAFEESEIYAANKEKRLPELFSALAFIPTRSDMITDPSQVYQCENLDWPTYDYDFAIFPVAVDMAPDQPPFILNLATPYGDIIQNARSIMIDGESVAVPRYYGVTPFIFLDSLVKKTFQLCGYDFDGEYLENDDNICWMVVLNTCADASCSRTKNPGTENAGWSFCYGDIVPDITVGELMTFMRNTFGYYFWLKGNTVKCRPIEQAFRQGRDFDFSPYVLSKKVIYPGQKMPFRSFDTSLQSPAAKDIETLRASHRDCYDNEASSGKGLAFDRRIGQYNFKKTSSSSPEQIGNDCFPFYRNMGNLEEEKFEAGCQFCPSYRINGKIIPYAGERHHRFLDLTAKSSSGNSLKVVYAHVMPETPTSPRHYCGSSYSWNENGTPASLPGSSSAPIDVFPAITPEGLEPLYWKALDELLINGYPKLLITVSMPLEQLHGIDRMGMHFIDGASALIESMSYSISEDPMTTAEITLQIIPKYSDAITIPKVTFNKTYQWKLVNTEQKDHEIIGTDGVVDYTMTDAPVNPPTKGGEIVKRRQRWHRIRYRKYWGPNNWFHETVEAVQFYEEYFIGEASGN